MFLPAFRISLPCCKYTKSTINFTKIAKGFCRKRVREREKAKKQSKKYVAECWRTFLDQLKLCVNILRTVPCALSKGKFVICVTIFKIKSFLSFREFTKEYWKIEVGLKVKKIKSRYATKSISFTDDCVGLLNIYLPKKQ